MDAQKKWKIKKANGDIYGPIKTDIVINNTIKDMKIPAIIKKLLFFLFQISLNI